MESGTPTTAPLLVRLRNAWCGSAVKRAMMDYQWHAIGLLFVAAAVLGWWGLRLEGGGSPAPSWRVILYETVQLFWLNHNSAPGTGTLQIEWAQAVAAVLFLVLSGKVVLAFFVDQINLLYVGWLKEHVVVCGLGQMGMRLVESLTRPGCREGVNGVVAIEHDAENDNIAAARSAGAMVIVGSAMDRTVLRRAGFHRAKWLVALTEDDQTNSTIAGLAGELGKGVHPTIVRAHISQPALLDFLREADNARQEGPQVFFNSYETAAMLMLDRCPPIPEPDLGPATQFHVLVVGMGELGQALTSLVGRWAALLKAGTDGKARMRLTVVSRDAKAKVSGQAVLCPWLVENCEIVAHDMDVMSEDFRAGRFLHGSTANPPNVAYVCLNDDNCALAVKGMLRGVESLQNTHLVVRVANTAISTTSAKRTQSDFSPLHLLDGVCDPRYVFGEAEEEQVARANHLDYLLGHVFDRTLSRKKNTVPWSELSDEIRETNHAQARARKEQLKRVGCHLAPLRPDKWNEPVLTVDEVEKLARWEHERWFRENKRLDWTHGEKRDDKNKIHDKMLPWEKLSDDDQERLNRKPARRLPLVLAIAGYRIERIAPGGKAVQ